MSTPYLQDRLQDFTCTKVEDAGGTPGYTVYKTKLGARAEHSLYLDEVLALWVNIGKALGPICVKQDGMALSAAAWIAAEPKDVAKEWRTLALQFDHQRMQALTHLRVLVDNHLHYDEATRFLAAAPVPGTELLDKVRAELLAEQAASPDWTDVGRLLTAASSARAAGHLVGTSNWGAHVVREMGAEAQPHRTEQEIVDQTEDLAIQLLNWVYGRKASDPSTKIYNSPNSRAVSCWEMACKIQELMTGTDAVNALQEVQS